VSALDGLLIDPELLKHATPAELEAYEQALKLEQALLSPLDYALYVSPTQAMAFRHVELLNQWIIALVEGRLYLHGPGPAPVLVDGELVHPVTGEKPVYRLTISMPPRHGKSFLVSDHLPAWFLTKYNELRAILASYEADFAASWGLKARNHVQEHPELGVTVSTETRSGARWNLEGFLGGMVTAGAGGAITGKGAHLFIIDDPIKNAEEAFSATQRQTLYDWYLSTAFTRLQTWGCADCGYHRAAQCEHEELKTPGRIILMNTRWHEDDLNGRVMRDEPDQWAVLNLPAVAETENDQMGRLPGEVLCPELFSINAMERIKAAQTPYFWAAMYQGRPNIEGGGLISKPFRYHRLVRPAGTDEDLGRYLWGTYELTDLNGAVTYVPEKDCYRFATMDVAGSVKTSADWTVFSVWDLTPGRVCVLHDRVRVRMEQADHEEKLREWYAMYPKLRFVGIENKTFGTYLIKNMVRNGGVTVRPLEADTDKVARAIPYGSAIRTGRFSFPAEASWLHEWEHEHLQFPNGTHDDQVDTGAYAVQIMDLMPAKLPQHEAEPVTMQEKVDAYAEKKFGKKRKRRSHPMLGRM
jgi:predicted phage terminase large subunit-like protein